ILRIYAVCFSVLSQQKYLFSNDVNYSFNECRQNHCIFVLQKPLIYRSDSVCKARIARRAQFNSLVTGPCPLHLNPDKHPPLLRPNRFLQGTQTLSKTKSLAHTLEMKLPME
ncbi:MAG: hypothetical protein MHPSP_000320, partial [Paramarteilia canceri]